MKAAIRVMPVDQLEPIARIGQAASRPIRGAARSVLWHVANSWMQRRSECSYAPGWPTRFDQTGLAFVHIPKNAGISISSFLYGAQIGHWRWYNIRQLNPVKYRKWTKFAVVRDPVERFLSAYDFLVGGGMNQLDEWFARDFVRPHADVNEFLRRIVEHSRLRECVLGYWHFHVQSDYVCTASGICMVNRLVPFDGLSAEVPRLAGRREPVPAKNVTTGARTQRKQLSRSSIAILNNLYARDYRLLAFAANAGADTFGQRVFEP